jgi:NADPH:quinone reductase
LGGTVLVQGGAGAVGSCAVQLAHQAGARVIATCRSESDKQIALEAGADEVLLTDDTFPHCLRGLAPAGVDHIVEVAFQANIGVDIEALAQAGSIATYATNSPDATIPVWQLVFKNMRMYFVGSDDVPPDAKLQATRDINEALESGWRGLDIAAKFPIEKIAAAHEWVEHPKGPGRVVVVI